MVELWTFNPGVVGSNPTGPSIPSRSANLQAGKLFRAWRAFTAPSGNVVFSCRKRCPGLNGCVDVLR